MNKLAMASMIQLEQALNNFQNGMYDDSGALAFDHRWIETFDSLLEQLITSRALADKAQGALTKRDWNTIDESLRK